MKKYMLIEIPNKNMNLYIEYVTKNDYNRLKQFLGEKKILENLLFENMFNFHVEKKVNLALPVIDTSLFYKVMKLYRNIDDYNLDDINKPKYKYIINNFFNNYEKIIKNVIKSDNNFIIQMLNFYNAVKHIKQFDTIKLILPIDNDYYYCYISPDNRTETN